MIRMILCWLAGWWDGRKKRIHVHDNTYTSGFIHRVEKNFNKDVARLYRACSEKIQKDYQVFAGAFIVLTCGERFLDNIDPEKIEEDVDMLRKKSKTIETCERTLGQCAVCYEKISVVIAVMAQEIGYRKSCANQMIAAYLQGSGVDPKPDGTMTTEAKVDGSFEAAFYEGKESIEKEIKEDLKGYRETGVTIDKYNAGIEGVKASTHMFEGNIFHATELAKKKVEVTYEETQKRLFLVQKEINTQTEKDIAEIDAYVKELAALAENYRMDIETYESAKQDRYDDIEHEREQKKNRRNQAKEQDALNAKVYADNLLAAKQKQEEEENEIRQRNIAREKAELEEHEKRMRMLKESDDMLKDEERKG